MIDEYSLDRTGWARFSDDRLMRYRLQRKLTPYDYEYETERRVVFVMLNPSTADAFKLDPTVTRCAGFARQWNADVLEVVNLFALRSTDPELLYVGAKYDWRIGDDVEANQQILEACVGAWRVIAAWGVHGALRDRGAKVASMLRTAGVELRHLGLTKAGLPRHPLYLKAATQPEVWAP